MTLPETSNKTDYLIVKNAFVNALLPRICNFDEMMHAQFFGILTFLSLDVGDARSSGASLIFFGKR